MKRAVFLDRDGTINYDKGYTYKLEDLKIYDDIIPILKKYYDSGYIIIVISNQSGINRGYFTVNDMKKFNDGIKRFYGTWNCYIGFLFCPHKPEENCECRKPKTGMVEQAVKKYGIDLKNSIVIGDRDDIDGELARNLGIKFIKVHGYSAP
ncbi:HAD family hydrolase [Acidiplasma cupricumulans]|uniref:D-glycero-alpha-D-manno-heptose-1,7-bisphosphate 7-phosphatase n=1 Tax=Acidiplasma cupricumulans TaxID=312540 RepID=UPI000780E753|nr:HAD family hydrolase [Acidiplasma cupricumulans]